MRQLVKNGEMCRKPDDDHQDSWTTLTKKIQTQTRRKSERAYRLLKGVDGQFRSSTTIFEDDDNQDVGVTQT